jgi:hypothetical protein
MERTGVKVKGATLAAFERTVIKEAASIIYTGT